MKDRSKAIRRLRREQLLRAAYELLSSKSSYDAMTVAEIARHVGASKGIVHHYFRSKDDLLEQMIRYSYTVFRQAVVDRLKKAASPSARLWSVIDADFDSDVFQPSYCAAWIAVYELGGRKPRLRHITEIADKRFAAHVFGPLRHLVPPAEVEPIAYSLISLIDGCWSLAATEPGVTRKAAMSMIGEFLRTHVPAFDMSVVKLDD